MKLFDVNRISSRIAIVILMALVSMFLIGFFFMIQPQHFYCEMQITNRSNRSILVGSYPNAKGKMASNIGQVIAPHSSVRVEEKVLIEPRHIYVSIGDAYTKEILLIAEIGRLVSNPTSDSKRALQFDGKTLYVTYPP